MLLIVFQKKKKKNLLNWIRIKRDSSPIKINDSFQTSKKPYKFKILISKSKENCIKKNQQNIYVNNKNKNYRKINKLK